MSETAKMFDEMLNDTESFFVPGEDKKTDKPKSAPNVRGEFYGHLQESSCREVGWSRDGKNFKAIVYNYNFVIDAKTAEQTYKGNNDTEYSGKDYVGRSYKANGVFRFLEPKEGDDFVSNAKGNDRYLRFCETLGKDIPRKVVQMNGQDVEVQVLPQLKADDINGKPAIAIIDAGNPYKTKEGQERTPYEVKYIKTWEGGTTKDEEIPF